MGSGQAVSDLAAFNPWLYQEAHRKGENPATVDVARYAPNGANRQVIHWVVINDPAKAHRVAEMTIEWMKVVKEKIRPFTRKPNWDCSSSPGSWARIAFAGAPCIIMACAPKDERTAPPAAMIAIHQIQLAAPGLGLGTTFTGSINTASQGYPPLVDMLGLPEGYIPHATCVIGYPAEKYLRIPVRKPVNVTWC